MVKLKEIQGVVGANVRNLREKHAPQGYRTTKAFGKWVGVGNGTVNRIENSVKLGHDARISSLAAIAEKFGLEPWMLLIPNLDPRLKPHVLSAHEIAWHLKMERLLDELPKPPEPPGPNTNTFAPPPGKKAAHRRKRR